jgi:hypothetical protein
MLKRFLFAVWLAVVTALPALATSVLPLDLGQVIDQSVVVFQGTAVDNRTGRDPQTGMLVTMTTFRVDDVLKGELGSTYTIKQIGGTDSASNLHFKVYGVPKYTVGQSYVLFMNGVSSAGFTSPVGLSQGRFLIQDGEVGNGRDFDELTAGTGMQLPDAAREKAAGSKAHTRLKLDDFKQMVRTHAGRTR